MIISFAKTILFWLGTLLALPFILAAKLEEWLGGPERERIYSGCKECLALVPTIIGEYVRLGFYVACCTGVSRGTMFMLGSMVAHRATTIGPGTVIGVWSIIGFADIGRDVLVAARVSIISGRYQHGKPEERTGGEETEQPVYRRIAIGDHTWIGEGAVVMADVGENCTVAASAVIYNPAQAGGTYIGNPARKVNIAAKS